MLKDADILKEAFTDLLEKNKKLIFKVSGLYCRNPEERKDLAQEIVIQLWKAFPKYDDQFSLSTWIYRIALNVSISFYRKEKTREKIHAAYATLVDWIHWDENIMDERSKQLYDFIGKLNPLDKAIILLYLEGVKNKDIAGIMGMSSAGVNTRVFRIKEILIENFKTQNL